MAAIINQDKSDEFLRPYLPSRKKVISDQKQRDHERANRLFHALDESGDGVLEVSRTWLVAFVVCKVLRCVAVRKILRSVSARRHSRMWQLMMVLDVDRSKNSAVC